MFEEIKNNKWTVLLVIVIFAILEIQIIFLSNQAKNASQSSSASSESVSEVVPPTNDRIAFGKVKKIEGSDIILSILKTAGEVRIKTTPATKIQQRIPKPAD